MLKISEVEVVGWRHAIRGMRNALESWDRSDSVFAEDFEGDDLDAKHNTYEAGCFHKSCDECKHKDTDLCLPEYTRFGVPAIGPNDRNLMMKLRKAGTDHRKFMRMIVVYLDIDAPLYWWKEYDTYKVGTVANSCSTMHTIHKKELDVDNFSHEHLDSYSLNRLKDICSSINYARRKFLQTADKKEWWQMIQLLPTSFNQKRTVMLNYEVLANIYNSRKFHKLDEWKTFCNWIEELPYSELITGYFEEEENANEQT